MKDKVYMFLAFVGFVIIAIICIRNYDGSQELKEFGPGTYYTPQARYGTTNSNSLFNQMVNRRAISCPQTQLIHSDDSIVLSSVAGSKHGMNLTHFFTSRTCLGLSETATVGSKSGLWGSLNIDPTNAALKKTDGSVTFKDLCTSTKWNPFDGDSETNVEDNHYYEIIAPFQFTYDNINTSLENGEDIVIVCNSGNYRGKCRITFGNVANWFCAGYVGQPMTVKNGTKEGDVTWYEHSKYHQTIIGNSKNADINGGNGGAILGYAKYDTTITIEIYNGSWTPISIEDFIKKY